MTSLMITHIYRDKEEREVQASQFRHPEEFAKKGMLEFQEDLEGLKDPFENGTYPYLYSLKESSVKSSSHV